MRREIAPRWLLAALRSLPRPLRGPWSPPPSTPPSNRQLGPISATLLVPSDPHPVADHYLSRPNWRRTWGATSSTDAAPFTLAMIEAAVAKSVTETEAVFARVREALAARYGAEAAKSLVVDLGPHGVVIRGETDSESRRRVLTGRLPLLDLPTPQPLPPREPMPLPNPFFLPHSHKYPIKLDC